MTPQPAERKPLRVLELFCGAGGAAMGLHRAWPHAKIVGVDVRPQKRYPFTFIQADAMEISLAGYDFIWASPPCQFYCAMKTMRNRREHPDLVAPVRKKLIASGLPFVIENVFGAPLHHAIMLCGSMFKLWGGEFQLRRHRYFETNFHFLPPGRCHHARKTLGVYGSKVRDIAEEKRHYGKSKALRGKPQGVVLPQALGFEAMGIDWMKIEELSEAIPPAYSEYIAGQWSQP
jgi:DNA (cytosine-5)-methyltransferase 1